MPNVRIATFNCENLFARFKFNSNVDPQTASINGFDVNMTKFDILNPDEKALSAKAIAACKADIVALQEVDNLDVLRRFNRDRLKNSKYTFQVLIDGPDPRHIDVAVLSKFPIVHVRSYQHLKDGSRPLFSRDCLEVDIDVNGKVLPIFVNHFKSMLDKSDPANGRKNTRAKREKQARAVRDLLKARFGTSAGAKPWVVLGDLNDYPQADQNTTSGINDLTGWNQLENVLDRLPQAERWTHFYQPKANTRLYRQLDYILVSKALSQSTASPSLIRKGLTPKAIEVTDARFPEVTTKIVASDHCPQVVDIAL
jgi:endonuclease/exonuclease/phosphatase family metal-dependent hydrolase